MHKILFAFFLLLLASPVRADVDPKIVEAVIKALTEKANVQPTAPPPPPCYHKPTYKRYYYYDPYRYYYYHGHYYRYGHHYFRNGHHFYRANRTSIGRKGVVKKKVRRRGRRRGR